MHLLIFILLIGVNLKGAVEWRSLSLTVGVFAQGSRKHRGWKSLSTRILHQDKQSYSVVLDYLGSLSNTVIRNSRSSLSSAFREEEVAMHFCIPTREYGTVPAPTTTTPTRCVISAVSSMTSNKSLFCIVDRSHNLQGLGEQWVSIKGEAEGGETKEREQRNPPTFDGHMDIGQPSVLSRVHHHVSTHSFAFDLQKWQQMKAPRDS